MSHTGCDVRPVNGAMGDKRTTTILQLLPQLLNLLLELSQKSILGIFINLGFVLDVLGAVGVAEGADCFIVVVVSWAQVGHLGPNQRFHRTLHA